MATYKTDETLITFAEMATKYGYSRGSIGAFPHRHEDFPQPVGVESTVKYYSRSEIDEWFTDYRSKGKSKLGEGRAPRSAYKKRNPVLDEIMNQISHDLILQSKVLIFLAEQKTK